MGRLFWKFFALAWLVQAAVIGATGLYLGMLGPGHHERAPEMRGPPPAAGWPDRPSGGARPGREDDGGGPLDRARNLHLFGIPIEPIAGGLIASLVSAALIAWNVARPVRTLKSAIDAASAGNLRTRIADTIGNRHDELADLGRDFDRMIERLRVVVDGQRRLLHDVSHEMRSPLARVQAAIGLARQEPAYTGAAMDRIERESIRMDGLVGSLLALARLQAGFAGSMDERVDLDELVMTLVDDASFEAEAKGRRVSLVPGCRGVVKGNADLLRRGIENIVRNAVKYTREGGTVTVETAAGAGARSACVAVSDEGPGVPEQDLESIFEPFFRAPGATGHDGHGLGLAIARRAIEAHGGSIRASNRAEGGLCVRIELPVVSG